MSKPTTHVLMVVDMSGSMMTLAGDVRGGFNTYIADLVADKDSRYRLTAALFDNLYEPLCVAAKLKDVPKLDARNYTPRGMTALLDAVGKTVADFDARVPTLADGDRVLVVVQTDGYENASHEFTREQIRTLIADREATKAWSFVFLGAGPDVWQQAGAMGFDRASTVAVAATGPGTRSTYSGLAGATRSYSRGATGAEASGIVADEAGNDAS